MDKYLAAPVEDYERALASRSQGLVRGRSAWNDGKETFLVDFPLVLLVVRAALDGREHPRRRPRVAPALARAPAVDLGAPARGGVLVRVDSDVKLSPRVLHDVMVKPAWHHSTLLPHLQRHPLIRFVTLVANWEEYQEQLRIR